MVVRSILVAFVLALRLLADPVSVRHAEGLVHGFLVLRDLDDRLLATGELSQVTTPAQVTNELVFHFKDGSLRAETTVFSQRRVFRLISYHLVQKGPAFKTATDFSINALTGQTTVQYAEDGKNKTISEQVQVPDDLANGLISVLLKNVDPAAPKTTVSMIVTTPKPRLVKLEVSPAGEESFSVAGSPRKATRFVVHVNIGGVAGVVAPIVGKQPADTNVWIVEGKAPGFLKSEGPQYDGGPIWRIQLASPEWPKTDRK